VPCFEISRSSFPAKRGAGIGTCPTPIGSGAGVARTFPGLNPESFWMSTMSKKYDYIKLVEMIRREFLKVNPAGLVPVSG